VEKVVALANLSQGIVRFYFDSKDAMLVASLAYLAAEFEEHVLQPVAALKADPVQALTRLVELYFDPVIASARKVSVWYAFWGEASSRQEYYAICGKKDSDFEALVQELVGKLIAKEGSTHLDADAVALGLIGVLEVLWQYFAFQDEANVDRERARQRSMAYLRSAFPVSFGGSRAVARAPAAQAPPSVPDANGAAPLPPSAYASAELLVRERAQLLRPAWQLVGHEAQVTKAGDFLVRDLAGERALVLRDEAGQLRVFRNACPHRPHALIERPQGRLSGPLTCTAHQLSFGWDGRQTGGVAAGDLTPLEVVQRGPLIFVRGARGPGSAADAAPPEVAGGMPPGLVPAGEHEHRVEADWKLVVEQWLDAAPAAGTFLAPNQRVQREGGVLEILQVIPEAPGRCRLRAFIYAAGGKVRAASARWPGKVLAADIAQVESTQLGVALAGEDRQGCAPPGEPLASFRRAVRALL
jgi:TetR/AcrR family transcriptional regulator, transcriptional repressor of bet genes